MKIAVLGASHWHASCYYGPMMKLGYEVTLIDEEGQAAKEKAERNGLKWSADYAVLDANRPDFAFCLGRHDQMSDLTAMCVERKIPFMAEKPGGKNASTLFALSRRCEEMKLFNTSPFNYRYDTAVRRVKAMLASGELGRVSRIYCAYIGGALKRYADWGCPWMLEKEKALGGSIYNEAVHSIDLLRFWGFEPKYRAGRASYALNRGEVDDMISLMLDCGPDTYAIVESGYLVQNPYGGLDFNLFCEKANLDYRHGQMTIICANGEKEIVKSESPDARDVMLPDIFSRLAAGQPAASTLYDVAATLAICDAYREDAESK